MFSRLLFILIFLVFVTSCASKKDIYYFQNIDQATNVDKFNSIKIQPGDILDIQIKALNPESALVFQRQSSMGTQQASIENRMIEGYIVADDGTINIPLLGAINTTNQSPKSLANDIQKALISYIKDPSVNIRILNFRVSILGEVKNPGTFSILEERFTLPQALGLAGDLTINGDRKNVLIIRNENGKKINYNIDLTKSDFMQSPIYFLKQNDIVYIRPNTARIKSSGLIANASSLASIFSLALSLFIIVISR